MLREADFTADRVAKLLETRLTNPEDLAERAAAARTLGRPDAAETLAKSIDGLVRGALV
jgi:UDP-N-acetylglucosamine--N-acetylmuramyl-(pentapeptide) pyrophosphoryl-undecaprenol N-acetylglucosamine transferase